MTAEALQPLQRAFRSQTQGNSARPATSTPPSSHTATPQLNPPPRGAWQNQQPRKIKASGEEIPTSPTARVVDSFSRMVGTTVGRRRHRTFRVFNSRSSNVLSPRQRPIVHIVVQDVSSAVNGVVTVCSTEPTRLNNPMIVVRHLLGTMSATVRPRRA